MENKCNKTPNSHNKYLDHVYCQNAGNGGRTASSNSDLLAMLKENKQLKTMLILHLNLIREQSDQLIEKDKQLVKQNNELDVLRTKNSQLESQLQELQRQLQRQLKRSAEFSSVPPPPLAKIQCKAVESATTSSATSTTNIIGECNGKLISRIVLHRVSLRSPNSTTTSETASDADESTGKIQHEEDDPEEGDVEVEAEAEAEAEAELEDTPGNTTEESNDGNITLSTLRSKVLRCQESTAATTPAIPTLNISRGAKPLRVFANTPPISIASTTTSAGVSVQLCVTPPTPSRGKQMPLMRWHASDMHSDESVSCDSMADTEQHSTSAASPSSIKLSEGEENREKKCRGFDTPATSASASATLHEHRQIRTRRCAYITTPQMYCTREWEDEDLGDYEFIKEEANALRVDAPMLEIPKWTEHEVSVSYCIEGTEDLSDDTFMKRHAKLEIDEKRRKKWDVQQIREQRRIEKLKRRHCKEEIPTTPEMLSFYPQPDAIQTICYNKDLPVQAFGEMIPKLNTISTDFVLPWLETTTTTTTTTTTIGVGNCGSVATLAQSNISNSSTQALQQMTNSSFVFLKKRRRQQSSSMGLGAMTARQRKIAAASQASTTTTTTTENTNTNISTGTSTGTGTGTGTGN